MYPKGYKMVVLVFESFVCQATKHESWQCSFILKTFGDYK